MDSRGEDYEIPKAVINRLIKASLPDNVQVAKDAKGALSKSARIFIQFLTACSNDICLNEDKAKITTEHVIKALEEMEFDFGSKLQEFITQHRLDESTKKARKETQKENANDAETEKKDDSSTSIVVDVDMDKQKDDVDDQNDGDDKEGDE